MLRMYKHKNKTRQPLRRYVYLMERTSQRTWSSIVNGRREIKIGVSKNTKQRHRTVDLGIPGRVVILDQYKVDKASRVETELHKLFEAHNFTVKGAKAGSGSTEFFRLTNRQIRQARRILRRRQRQSVPPFWKIVFASIIITYLAHYFIQ